MAGQFLRLSEGGETALKEKVENFLSFFTHKARVMV